METRTDPAVIVLTLATVAFCIYAWWLSIQRSKRVRRLVQWLEHHHGARWRALSKLSRGLHPVGAVEHFRRKILSEDPEFMTLYRETKAGTRRQLAAILAAVVCIGLVQIGVRVWGWSW